MLDVAREAGVSRATVSLVMRGSTVATPATRDKVFAAAERLGYVYDRSAARLRTRSSNVVGLVVTDNSNPFFSEFASSVEARLREEGHVALIGFTHDDAGRQASVLRSLVEDRVAGVILVPAVGSTPADLAGVTQAGIRLVVATRPLPVGDAYVGTDDRAGGAMVARHLLEHGCRRLAFFGGLAASTTRRARAGGFESALSGDAEIDAAWHVASDPEARGAFEHAVGLLARRRAPDGIGCNSDPIAFGLMRALSDAGLEVGRDVRVVGFDDLAYSALWRPSLTSVRVEPNLLGLWAAEAVLGTAPPHRGIHSADLALRESCGCG